MPPIDGKNFIDMSERKVENIKLNIGADITIPVDEVHGRDIDRDGDKGRIIGGRLLRPGEKIYDLVDACNDQGNIESQEDLRNIVVAGQSDERTLRPKAKIFDLVDVVEEGGGVTSLYSGLNKEIVEKVSHIAEKIARKIIPEIAERVIREEIEKLKKDDDYGR